MRLIRLLLTLAVLFGVLGLACARVSIKVQTVGFDGNYRPRTLVPILVMVQNSGDTVRGEFRVLAPNSENALPDTYRTQMTIPRGAKLPLFFYVVPRHFTREFEVRFTTTGAGTTSSSYNRCQEVYNTDRLLVVIGGNGSSLNIVNGQVISVSEFTTPRPWGNASSYETQRGYYPGRMPPGGSGATASGKINLAYVDGTLLPENPEAYGSVDMLALMADVTENTLKSTAQEAIPIWVANGGHLLIANSAVRGRLEAAFYTQFINPPVSAPVVRTLTNADGGKVQVRNFGTGHVSLLDYDPDTSVSRDWRKISTFYGKLMAQHAADLPITAPLRDAVNTAVMVRNLKPPNLRLIVIFLLIYLVMLVPVNYFVLKKLDKRELAWVTTPVIVLLFTFGAYGIGYITKGHRLVTNMVSLVETVAGQPSAEATTQLLIFSPSRTRYQLNLGNQALVTRETNAWNEEDPYGRERDRGDGLHLHDTDTGLLVERLQVNMWAFRQLTMAHQIDLGRGMRATLKDTGSAAPHVTGTVTNGTPFAYPLCELYANGKWVSSFSMKAGERVTVSTSGASPTVKLDEQGQYMLDSLRDRMKTQAMGSERMREGYVLIGYTADPHARVPLKINGRQPSGTMTVVVTHL
jgi:hypothetical protein